MADSPFMLRPAARAAPPGFPPDVAPNQIIYAAHINAIRDSAAVWPGNVDGNLKTLSNVGALGVGTASPSFKLDVAGGRSQFVPASEPYAIGVKYSAASPVFWIGADSGGDLRFSSAGGNELVRIAAAAGHMGVGISLPEARLHVEGSGVLDYQLILGSGAPTTSYEIGRQGSVGASLGWLRFHGRQPSYGGYVFSNVDRGPLFAIFNNATAAINSMSPSVEAALAKLVVVGEVGQAAGNLAESNTKAVASFRPNQSSGYTLAIGSALPGNVPYIQAVNYNGGAAAATLLLNPYGGDIQMWLGGSLKTLSVDGNGFVKAA